MSVFRKKDSHCGTQRTDFIQLTLVETASIIFYYLKLVTNLINPAIVVLADHYHLNLKTSF
jgi:hypothetical protein